MRVTRIESPPPCGGSQQTAHSRLCALQPAPPCFGAPAKPQLVHQSCASVLCNSHMMQTCSTPQAQGGVLPAEEQAASGRTYQITRVAIRTLWFDRQLLAALDAERQPQPLLSDLSIDGGGDDTSRAGGGGGDCAAGVRLSLRRNATPRQVVLLGAGMDTRAWRLALPAGAAFQFPVPIPIPVPQSLLLDPWFKLSNIHCGRQLAVGVAVVVTQCAGKTISRCSSREACRPHVRRLHCFLQASGGLKWTGQMCWRPSRQP